ncbi:MarR family winged helix-turn-helix transcriptional regulator [Calidifontibacter terrae]
MDAERKTDQVRWLDDQQQAAWRDYIRGSRALETVLDNEIRAASGMSLSEFELLSMLSETDGRTLRMSTLADLVVQSRSRVTHAANRLERRGWVVRAASDHDGRGVDLTLTDAGFEAVVVAAKAHVMSVRAHLVDRMAGAELVALGATMAKVRAGL